MRARRVLLVLAVCGLAASPLPAQNNELTEWLSAREPAPDGGLDAVASGALRVTWRRDGPALTIGTLRTLEQARRSPQIRGHHPFTAEVEGCHVFATFRHGTRNRLGGRTVARADDAEAALSVTWEAAGGAFARLRFEDNEGGDLRLATRLHDASPFNDALYYLDARPFDTVAFWVRGASDARVGLIDATLDNDGGTPRSLGAIADLTVATADSRWSLVEVPLATIPDTIDVARLAEISVHPVADGGTLDLGPMALCRSGHQPQPPETLAAPPGFLATGRAIWVWHTAEAMTETAARDALVDLVREAEFDRVYLQLPRGFASDDTTRRSAAQARFAGLVEVLHAAGAEAHALDGAADFALPDNHADVLESIAAIVNYNDSVDAGRRLRGVHLDVEPYLLDGFSGERRDEIVAGYLQLLDRVDEVTRPAGLYFEVAIPFWFDGIAVHEASTLIDGAESFRPLSEATIDRVDAVALMDYRTRADGSGGTVALAASELDYAAARGTHVRIGLETTWLPDEETLHFEGPGSPGLPDGESSRPWIVAGAQDDLLHFFVVPDVALERLPEALRNAGLASSDVRHWRPSRRTRVPADRLTFHDLGIEPLRRVIDETNAEATRYPSYAGVAIHYDRTYRRLLAGQ